MDQGGYSGDPSDAQMQQMARDMMADERVFDTVSSWAQESTQQRSALAEGLVQHNNMLVAYHASREAYRKIFDHLKESAETPESRDAHQAAGSEVLEAKADLLANREGLLLEAERYSCDTAAYCTDRLASGLLLRICGVTVSFGEGYLMNVLGKHKTALATYSTTLPYLVKQRRLLKPTPKDYGKIIVRTATPAQWNDFVQRLDLLGKF